MSIQNLNKFGGKMLKIFTTPVFKRNAPSVASCRTIYVSSCTKTQEKLTTTELREQRKLIVDLTKSIEERKNKIEEQKNEFNEQRKKIEERTVKIEEQRKEIEEQKEEIKELSIRVDYLKLGHYAHKLRSDIIMKIFRDRAQVPLKTIKQVEECASGSKDFKMTDEEMGRWKTFTSDLKEEGISVEEIDKGLQSLIDRSWDTVVNPRIK